MLTALLETTTATDTASSWLVILMQLLPILLVVVAMYFILIRPQRKRENTLGYLIFVEKAPLLWEQRW